MDDRFATLKDEQLLEMLAEQGLYRDEVIERVRQISRRRGLISNFDQMAFRVIRADGQDVGPLDALGIRDLFQQHSLLDTSLLYVDSLNRWTPLSEVFETSFWVVGDATLSPAKGPIEPRLAETAITKSSDSPNDFDSSPTTPPNPLDTTPQTSNSQDASLKGVGGWLLWFIIGQLVCRPLQFVGTLSGPNSANASQIADRFPFTATVINIEKIVMIASIALGVIVALALLRTDDSRPVTLAKIYLVANTVFSLLLAILYSTNDLPDKARSDLITQGISNLVVTSILCGIWFLYFTKSRRVRATYLEEGFGTSDELTSIGITRASEAPPVQVDSIEQANNRGTRSKMKLIIAIGGIVALLAGIGVLLRLGLRADQPTTKQDQLDLKVRAETKTHDVGAAADKAASSLNDLRSLGLVSTKSEAERGIASIETAQAVQTEARNKNSELIKFAETYRSDLQNQGLGQLVEMTGAYGETYSTYQNALSEFLASYHEMLLYVRDHSDAIQQSLPPYRSRYEALYHKYVAALQKQNKAYLEHVAFLRRYANEHPSIANTLNEIISKTGQ